MRSMRILIQTILPSPYRVDFFNELGKYCDLTVIYEGKRPNNGLRFNWNDNKQNNYKAVYLHSKFDNKLNIKAAKYFLSNKYDIKLICCYHTKTGMFLISLMKLFSIKYYIEIDGGMIKPEEGFFHKKLKQYMLHGAYKYLSPSESTDEYFKYYAQANKNQIYRYSFTSISQAQTLKQVLSPTDKEKIKKQLGIPYQKMILAVGQFIPRKGFDILLRSIKDLPSNVGVYFIGGKMTKEYESIISDLNLNNIQFLEFMDSQKLSLYYKASDIFILPTREDIWGLVINEAMAYGLPIITTNKCVAGVQLLDHQEITIIPPEDSVSLRNSINKLLTNDNLLRTIGTRNLDYIKKHCIEDMAQEHIDIFSQHKTSNQ